MLSWPSSADSCKPMHAFRVPTLGHPGLALYRYNRMYTVTAQCAEADVPSAKGILEGVLSSFQPPAVAA